MKKIDFSVVIPLYNKEKYINITLDSVLAQNYTNFEIIIIDDGSTDKSAEVIKNYSDKRVKYYYQKNEGVSAARNKGILLSQYDLIAFLDGDDIWQPDFLESIVKLYEDYPTASVFATAYTFKHENGSFENAKFSKYMSNGWTGVINNYFLSSLKDPLLTSSSIVVRKKVFDEIGMFQIAKALAEDLDMWARIALSYQITFDMTPRVIYRMDVVNNVEKTVVIKEDFVVITTLEWKLVQKKVNSELVPGVKKYISVYSEKCATRYYLASMLEDMNRMLNKAIKYSFVSNLPKLFIKSVIKKIIYNLFSYKKVS